MKPYSFLCFQMWRWNHNSLQTLYHWDDKEPKLISPFKLIIFSESVSHAPYIFFILLYQQNQYFSVLSFFRLSHFPLFCGWAARFGHGDHFAFPFPLPPGAHWTHWVLFFKLILELQACFRVPQIWVTSSVCGPSLAFSFCLNRQHFPLFCGTRPRG